MNITVKESGKWVRCIIGDDPLECTIMDTGETCKLTPSLEKKGIYELALQFLTLPPRALLCGLSDIIPTNGKKWTSRSCKIFKAITNGWPLRAYFKHTALLSNSYYVFLSSTCRDGYSIHVNTALCAFDVAVANSEGRHHPIWPKDSVC